MPIYEYECTHCHQQFDLMQKINDEPVKQCPQCFNDTVIRLVSAAGFQLKGSGWYATDFKHKTPDAKQTDTHSKPSTDSKASDTKTPLSSANTEKE